MSIRLSHINLFVADVDRSARFYATVFELSWDEKSVSPGFAYLDGGGFALTLQSADTPGAVIGQADSAELGFETDDLAAIGDRLTAAGAEVGPVQIMGWGSGFDARDLDGFRLSIFTRNLADSPSPGS